AVEVADPGPGEVLVRQRAVGLNFVDTYFRSGLYPTRLPSGLGTESAGVVEAVGDDVDDLAVGDRVARATGPLGACSELEVVPAGVLVPVPDSIDDRTAAAVLLKGLTVQYLIRQIHPVGPGTVLLGHAAAGGVGLILGQWAKALGATVIGTASTPAKRELALANGYDHVIAYRDPGVDVAAEVRRLTDGRGVDVVYDGVGADTFEASLDSLRPRGLLVTYGNASGAVPPVAPAVLAQKGSLFLTRPVLAGYADTPRRLRSMADDLFAAVTAGQVSLTIGQTFPLADVRRAHEALEAGETTGSTVLLP
ncbi:MAG TPA: quinone oxidoreductase, partial [Acidimicrobiales bacterium]|nr:quinone oxidoreductase [Acidimicrobiales bacterium]